MDLAEWEWTCACCGRRKRGVPDFGYDAPIHHHWAEQGDPDFTLLAWDSDTCTMEIAGERCFFIRCVLPIPIHHSQADLGLGLWSSLSAESFRLYDETYADPHQSRVGPLFGYLANRLPGYPETVNLTLDVLPQDHNQRPVLRVRDEHAGHPLCLDQTQGVDQVRLEELLSALLPCDGRA